MTKTDAFLQRRFRAALVDLEGVARRGGIAPRRRGVLATAAVAVSLALLVVSLVLALPRGDHHAGGGVLVVPTSSPAPKRTPISLAGAPMSRDQARAWVHHFAAVVRVDRVEVKRMTWAEYTLDTDGVVEPDTQYVKAADEVWVIAFSGAWHADAGPLRPSAEFILATRTGFLLGEAYDPKETWPSGFDALPDIPGG